MDRRLQIQKAELFLGLHHGPKLLVLPNVWDPLGARLLEKLGYSAVATASAAIAYSLGYDDGQRIKFTTMLDTIRRIAASVTVPLTADIERGYGERPEDVAENVRFVIRAGAVGVNCEDSTEERGPLLPIDVQCKRIQAIRKAGEAEGVPIVINARTDVWLSSTGGTESEMTEETIRRARAYIDAGANCIYPITLSKIDILKTICSETNAPINVYATASLPPMKDLEKAGISRISLGPGLLKASLTTMKKVALDLKNYGSYDSFTKDVITGEEMQKYISKDKLDE